MVSFYKRLQCSHAFLYERDRNLKCFFLIYKKSSVYFLLSCAVLWMTKSSTDMISLVLRIVSYMLSNKIYAEDYETLGPFEDLKVYC